MRRRAASLLAVLTVLAACGGVAPGARTAPKPPPPPAHAAWQWQLDGRLDASVPARVYDVDGFGTSRAQVTRLHRAGRYVVCYVDVGSWERWRPDAARFPRDLLGAENGWPGERWLDVRRIDALAPILRARFARCRAKGFDAVEPDNVDGYSNDSGFPLTAADQLRFNRWIARAAHAEQLAVALKNDLEQAPALAPSFDFAVLEQCFEYRECASARPFLRTGKGVYDAEYALSPSAFCADARRLGINAMRKRLELGTWREPC
ncbi:MAG TPA: endo alpha-1,4 polygalactosaminidase [Conexibacter sp.]|nr:endo alpha-1,4 polygalactosaminidase [Conexibacter sp.]